MPDKLRSMQVFLEVARQGSFSAAADALEISKAMTSRHVTQLENALGARLLNRTTRQISLTEAGEAYRDRVREILNDIDEAELAATQLTTRPRGTLRVMAPTSFGAFHLTRAIAQYHEQFPQVAVELELTEREPDFIEEGIDVAILVGRLGESSLIAKPLARTRFVLCAAPAYLERRGEPASPQDLVNHNCLQFSYRQPAGTWTFRGERDEYTVRITGDLKSNLGDAIRIAAIQGCGIAQLPAYMVGLDIKSGRLRALLETHEPEPKVIYAVYLHRRLLSAKIRTFIDFLYDLYQPRPYWDAWTEQGTD